MPGAWFGAKIVAYAARAPFRDGDQGVGTMKMNRSVARWLLLAVILLSFSASSFAQIAVGISVRIGPPALPVYAQPICPAPGYIWTPGYWAWNDDDGYYWVPGTWVVAPVGMLWTPGYWGWSNGFYLWHGGYWGPHIGFYGGINYGYGYNGVGFYGGEWRGRNFYYNRSVTNVYNKTVIVNNRTVNNVSYNGGTGGVRAEPTREQRVAERDHHTPPLQMQMQQQHLASQNKENFARVNQGKPAIAATARAGEFSSHSAIPARAAGAAYHPPAISPKEARGPSPTGNRPLTPANSNNANRTASGPKPSPQEKSDEGFRPFNPPSNGTAGSMAERNHNHANQTGTNEAHPQYHPNEAHPQYQSHPESISHPAPQLRQSPPMQQHQASPPPRPESHPAPQPQRSSPPPKEEHHKGR